MNLAEQVSYINDLREFIHDNSPFKDEPVDFVKWEASDNVVANDYNPNKVAPPEMELLEVSIMNDGYTQPIVTWNNPDKGKTEVIDGFHRNRVGKESKIVSKRIKGFLPVVNIRQEQSSKNDRIASTIRHNRARGKHQVDAMSEIVIELKNRNWTNQRIAKQLGMDEEEVLRLCQISGLENLFSDKDFSKAWIAEDSTESFEPITDDLPEEVIKNALVKNYSLEESVASKIANQSNGNYNKACDLVYQDSEDLQFEEWFIFWIRSAFKAKGNKAAIHDLISWSEDIAKTGRETQKQFLLFCLDFFRQAMLLNYNASDLVYLETKTAGFKLEKFAPFVHAGNILDIEKELNDALYHIERNGNPKIILLDLSMKLTRFLHKKETSV